jgi:hypothetical protein
MLMATDTQATPRRPTCMHTSAMMPYPYALLIHYAIGYAGNTQADDRWWR